jgi:hypothetical protein
MDPTSAVAGGDTVKDTGRLLWLAVGLVLGAIGAWQFLHPALEARAANDRYDDYILCTGTVADRKGAETDGLWMLDYRAGKLLGTLIDRYSGKIVGWAEVDLVSEFGIAPRAPVHFMMTTGQITRGQAALYIAETTSGKIGVYSMQPRDDRELGVQIKKHDLVFFREPKKN